MAGQLSQELYTTLANHFALYVMTLNCHWNVEDPRFHSLHEFFEELYTSLAEKNDAIAERIRQLGMKVPGSLSNFSKETSLKEIEKDLSANDMLKKLAESYDAVINHLLEIINHHEPSEDPVTIDFLTGLASDHQKTLWMLKSHLV